MIWLTLRQFRVQGAVVFGALAVLGALLAVTGPGLADDYSGGIASCTAQGGCDRFTARFFNDHQMYFGFLIALVAVLPGLIGIFWGAPLITRELEAGTHRLVWNQSVTRTRWLAVKLCLVGLSAMVAAGLAVLAADWWSSPLDKAGADRAARITPLVFDARGITPIGYAAFAFVLGVTVGVLVRRTLPAMAITLAVFVAVQVAMPLLIRPHLVPPVTKTVAITSDNLGEFMVQGDTMTTRVGVKVEPGAWTLSNDTVNASGRKVASIPASLATGPCAPQGPRAGAERPAGGPATPPEPPAGPPQECFDAIAQLGFKQKVVYQPADRFWPLQWAETGLFAVLALGLSGFCFYWTRRRLS